MSVTLKDGRKFEKYIQHAIGSVEVHMTDSDLQTKFADLFGDAGPLSRLCMESSPPVFFLRS
jgi:hypothetical protein